MALRYRIPLPDPFYYSGRVGPKHRPSRGSRSGLNPIGFVVKWFIIYPSVVIFGAGLAIMLAPFYGLFWVVRRSLRNRQGCQPVAQRFPVQRPLSQRPVPSPVSRPYGFVPAQRGSPAVEGGPFARIGWVRVSWGARSSGSESLFHRTGIASSVS